MTDEQTIDELVKLLEAFIKLFRASNTIPNPTAERLVCDAENFLEYDMRRG